MKNAQNNPLTPQQKPSAANAPNSRKEVVMNPEKLKIAYERLSRDDEAVGDSLSIQKKILPYGSHIDAPINLK